MRSVFPAVSTDILAAQPKVPRTLQSDIHRYQRLSGTALLCTYIRWVRINNVILDGGSFISLPQHITLERASRYLFQVHPWLSHGAHVDPMLSHPSPATAHHTTNQSDAISHWCLLFLGSPPANIYSLQVAERKPAANCVEQPFVDSCPRSDWILDIDTGHTSSGLSLLSTWLLSVYCKE